MLILLLSISNIIYVIQMSYKVLENNKQIYKYVLIVAKKI